MAIVIPSKNIYNKQNKKVIDNAIANINYNQNTYNKNIITMYTNSNIVTSSSLLQNKTFIGDWGTGGEAKRTRFELECQFYKSSFSGNSTDTIRGSEIKLLGKITSQGNTFSENFSNYEYLLKQKAFEYEMEDIPLPIPSSTDYTEIDEYVKNAILENMIFNVETNDTVANSTISYLKSVTVYLTEETLYNGVWGNQTKKTIGIAPNITKIELLFYLNYSEITSTASTIGKSGLSYSLEDNELLQNDTVYNSQPISKYIGNQVLEAYKNGKETATLVCDISDYYDENGKKVISIDTERMSFRMYDEVLPMVLSEDGKDIPMSKNRNATPKHFIVIGSEIYYDGAVWQKLSLIES